MDLTYTEEEEAFRVELREWLEAALPDIPPEPDRDDWEARRVWDTAWQRRLFDAGYAGINWPKEFGGRGRHADRAPDLPGGDRARPRPVRRDELRRPAARRADVDGRGDAESRRRIHLPGILKGEHVWCQGFSEPEAGSDLASLRTRAVRDGDDYVITGRRSGRSFAHVADYCELLVRTDPDAPKHRGITWLIMPMDAAGIDVRPLRTMEGSTEFCEMFLDEVRVPVANRVGAENDGWRVAMVTSASSAARPSSARCSSRWSSCATSPTSPRSSPAARRGVGGRGAAP